MEHWEALRPDGYRFVWEDGLFRPGTDSFVLSSLPRLKRGLRVCDLGSGTGLLGLLLLQREPSLTVAGLEQSPEAVALAERCAEINGLSGRLQSYRMDLRDAPARFSTGAFDLIVSNPPYYCGVAPSGDARRAARHESACTLPELVRAAAYLLRWGGAFCLVHKPERLADVLCCLREGRCEAKRLRLVHETADAPPALILVEGRRGGKPGLTIERPLVLRRPDGTPTPELDTIYFRDTRP
ncbi:MAG: methyltransferase [Oscillibacter sp.]|nr:methyltransferase [Oscillibacter sp.]